MKEEEEAGVKTSVDAPPSLRRSRVRSEILMYLYSTYPKASHPEAVSRDTGIDLKNVLKGLRGKGCWFKESDALLKQGVVEQVEHGGSTCYRLAERGKSMIESMQKPQGRIKS
ncbi:MAG: archaellum operon transcriptional activator EarA family protein [Candidatus Methanospirareceae archaeon]